MGFANMLLNVRNAKRSNKLREENDPDAVNSSIKKILIQAVGFNQTAKGSVFERNAIEELKDIRNALLAGQIKGGDHTQELLVKIGTVLEHLDDTISNVSREKKTGAKAKSSVKGKGKVSSLLPSMDTIASAVTVNNPLMGYSMKIMNDMVKGLAGHMKTRSETRKAKLDELKTNAAKKENLISAIENIENIKNTKNVDSEKKSTSTTRETERHEFTSEETRVFYQENLTELRSIRDQIATLESVIERSATRHDERYSTTDRTSDHQESRRSTTEQTRTHLTTTDGEPRPVSYAESKFTPIETPVDTRRHDTPNLSKSDFRMVERVSGYNPMVPERPSLASPSVNRLSEAPSQRSSIERLSESISDTVREFRNSNVSRESAVKDIMSRVNEHRQGSRPRIERLRSVETNNSVRSTDNNAVSRSDSVHSLVTDATHSSVERESHTSSSKEATTRVSSLIETKLENVINKALDGVAQRKETTEPRSRRGGSIRSRAKGRAPAHTNTRVVSERLAREVLAESFYNTTAPVRVNRQGPSVHSLSNTTHNNSVVNRVDRQGQNGVPFVRQNDPTAPTRVRLEQKASNERPRVAPETSDGSLPVLGRIETNTGRALGYLERLVRVTERDSAARRSSDNQNRFDDIGRNRLRKSKTAGTISEAKTAESAGGLLGALGGMVPFLVAKLLNPIKTMGKLFSLLGGVVATTLKPIQWAIDLFGTIGKSVTKVFGVIGKAFSIIMKPLSWIADMIGALAKPFLMLGKLLSKFTVVITIIAGIYDFVDGFIRSGEIMGKKMSGIGEKIEVGIASVISGLIEPFNWLAGLFGAEFFHGTKDQLTKSIVDFCDNFVSSVKTLFTDTVDMFKEFFAATWKKIKDMGNAVWENTFGRVSSLFGGGDDRAKADAEDQARKMVEEKKRLDDARDKAASAVDSITNVTNEKTRVSLTELVAGPTYVQRLGAGPQSSSVSSNVNNDNRSYGGNTTSGSQETTNVRNIDWSDSRVMGIRPSSGITASGGDRDTSAAQANNARSEAWQTANSTTNNTTHGGTSIVNAPSTTTNNNTFDASVTNSRNTDPTLRGIFNRHDLIRSR